MNIAIATDAWHPQISGVVTKLVHTAAALEALGHSVRFIHPNLFRTFPCPTYPQIRLALNPWKEVSRLLDRATPDAIHIATEGPIGLAARSYCKTRKLPFTTWYTTRFPEYVAMRFPIPPEWTYAGLRWFHSAATRVLVATEALKRELAERGFARVVVVPPGVDTERFHPRAKTLPDHFRPVLLYVGRVAIEKSIDDFLNLKVPGTKVVVGDGPDLNRLRRAFPNAIFLGPRTGEELARIYAEADVFVFPSRTDTFGLVLLEAIASGLPVAAYPVRGPLDVIRPGVTGVLDEDLARAVREALALDPERCRTEALRWTWENSARAFLDHLEPLHRNPS
ncbi:MAG: glycosyltransferase family 1 protein [Thermodesulfobacteriota bacterium]|nr:glycosyltransferase family 1 protein [Thermodesulfobacteriota bacterium]